MVKRDKTDKEEPIQQLIEDVTNFNARELQTLKDALEKFKSEVAAASILRDETLKQNTQEVKHLRTEVDKLNGKLKKMTDDNSKLSSEVQQLKDENNKLKKSFRDYDEYTTESKKDYGRLRDRVNKLEIGASELSKLQTATEAVKDDLATQTDRIHKELNNHKDMYGSLKLLLAADSDASIVVKKALNTRYETHFPTLTKFPEQGTKVTPITPHHVPAYAQQQPVHLQSQPVQAFWKPTFNVYFCFDQKDLNCIFHLKNNLFPYAKVISDTEVKSVTKPCVMFTFIAVNTRIDVEGWEKKFVERKASTDGNSVAVLVFNADRGNTEAEVNFVSGINMNGKAPMLTLLKGTFRTEMDLSGMGSESKQILVTADNLGSSILRILQSK